MDISSGENSLKLSVSQAEGQFLREVLSDLAEKYQTSPAELPSQSNEVLYSNISIEHLGSSEDDIEIWNDQLFEMRGQECSKIEKWIKSLEATEWPHEWNIEFDDVDSFIIVLNDRRLLCASEHELGDEELEHDFMSVENPAHRAALFEIHFLASIIENIIQEVSGVFDEDDEDSEDDDGY